MSGPSACQPRCENLSGEDSSRLVLEFEVSYSERGGLFYHKNGAPKTGYGGRN